MTALKKPVRRELGRSAATGRDRHRETIITLYPGGVIGFRAKGRRHEHRVSVDACYSLAVKIEAEAARKEKLAEKKSKRTRV